MDAETRATRLKKEAEKVIEQTGITTILSRYGETSYIGSYVFDLMTRRDIDICLSVMRPNPTIAFEIGSVVAEIPNVASMYYRNEYVLQTIGNPHGIFWCAEIVTDLGKWMFDILITTNAEITRVRRSIILPNPPLPVGLRRAILEIKSVLSTTDGYRKDYRSTDIYRAVIQDGVRSYHEWKKWWADSQLA